METLSFMAACRKYFGTRDGQTALDFGKEVRALTADDRKELAPLLAKELGCIVQE